MSADWTESAWRTQASIPPEDATVPETPRRVGLWELLDNLGRGQFAEVFLCRAAGYDVCHAAKRINKSRVSRGGAERRQPEVYKLQSRLNLSPPAGGPVISARP